MQDLSPRIVSFGPTHGLHAPAGGYVYQRLQPGIGARTKAECGAGRRRAVEFLSYAADKPCNRMVTAMRHQWSRAWSSIAGAPDMARTWGMWITMPWNCWAAVVAASGVSAGL